MAFITREKIERLEHLRFGVLRAFTIAFTVSYGTSLFLFIPFAHMALIYTAVVLGTIAWVFFLINLKKLLDLHQVVKNEPEVAAVLNDEFYRISKRKALATGFWGFLIACGLAIIFTATNWVNEVFIIQLVLLIGIDTALIKALILLKPATSEG